MGFGLMYPGFIEPGWFGFSGFFLYLPENGLTAAYASGGYTYYTDFLFQAMFAATCATIVSGAVAERIKLMRRHSVLLNFARNGIIDDHAVVPALDSGHLYAYVCDFPSGLLKGHPRVVTLPHLGASTAEAEENCAVMVAEQVRDWLENGNVSNSVNFPGSFKNSTTSINSSLASSTPATSSKLISISSCMKTLALFFPNVMKPGC